MAQFTIFRLVLLTLAVEQIFGENAKGAPEQIHLSLGNSHAEMVVTWNTYSPENSQVKYGTDQRSLDHTAHGTSNIFVDNGHRKHYIHRVVLKNLKPKTKYFYQCGSPNEWSKMISFKTLTDETNWSPKMIVYGDLGLNNGVTIPYIQNEVMQENVDLVFHNGDFAYDLDHEQSRRGDKFMNVMEPTVSRVAYQTSPGNHETYRNSSLENYVQRFTMYDMTAPSEKKSDHYYAFYLGPALIISINNEVYIHGSYSKYLPANLQAEQEAWLKALLEKANKPEHRAKYPWIILFGHQPMYCNSCPLEACCFSEADSVRKNLEEILFHYGVDLAIWSHIHDYERLWPVYRSKVYVDSMKNPYKNPKATVQIITGSAGGPELIDYLFFPRASWSAYGNSQYGYGILEIQNSTNLRFSQKALIESSADGQKLHVIDQIDIVQERHGIRSPLD